MFAAQTGLAAIAVTPTGDANLLASTILGSGVTIVGTPTLTGGNLNDPLLSSAGTFTGGLSTGIGINAGILLTSGYASNVGNVNTSTGITGDFQGPGDAALDLLIPGYQTYDATVLEIHFKSTTGQLSFNFAFGSDEYNEWANTPYNDVFGFFVDGVNIALLPGTTTPISIDNVNGGNPLGVNAQNPAYFRNNDPMAGGPFYPFEYDGFTTVFSVSASNLGTGEHTIRLAIADAGDNVLDTGVFIQAGSFAGSPTPPDDDPEDHRIPDSGGSLLLCVLGLVSLAGAAACHRASTTQH